MVQKQLSDPSPATRFNLSTVPYREREGMQLSDTAYQMMDNIRFLLQERKVPPDNIREVFDFLARINEEQVLDPPNSERLNVLFDEGRRILSNFGETPQTYSIETFCADLISEEEMREEAQNQITELTTFTSVLGYFDSPEARQELRYARLLSELLQNETSRETTRLVYLEVLIDEAHRSIARMEQIVMSTATEDSSSVREG
ncbi:hypothetical protein KKF81_05610 [Candidatus Micrarchaeota archaeon]|nr:hypothetical protein [Candidatus Micrarchaeota archaeon]MBU1886912.1 hypothetical protein [Candidatus Micrarchaeota archaeon]